MNALPSRFIPVGSKREHDLIQTVAAIYKERVAMYARVCDYFQRNVLITPAMQAIKGKQNVNA